MTKADFDQFVDSELAQGAGESFDAETRIEEWRLDRENFISSVKEFLKEYTESGRIQVEEYEKTIREERLGEYVANKYVIAIGGKRLKLEPVGTSLIGAKGRFDLSGPGRTSTFVLVPKDSTGPKVMVSIVGDQLGSEGRMNFAKKDPPREPDLWEWKLVAGSPDYVYKSIDSDVFFTAVMQAANG